MGFRDFYESIFGKSGKPLISNESTLATSAEQLWYMRYAMAIAAERYGALLSRCEFKTYTKNKEKRGDNWYLWNIKPNPNQSSAEFWKQVAHKLICDMECLIVVTDDHHWYVADSFTKGEYQISETWFTDVVVDLYTDGTVSPYAMSGIFKGDRAIYIKYTNPAALRLMQTMTTLYGKIVDNINHVGSSKLKYELDIDTTAVNGVDVDYNSEIERIVKSDFDKLVNDNNTIVPLLNGFKLNPLNAANNNAQNATTAAGGVRNQWDDMMVNIGQIYNIPASVMKGTYEENDMDDFLTFGLDPFTTLIEEAINRKYYTKKSFLEGTYVMVDTKKVKHFDILTVSDSINKLISSGVYTINELRAMLDEQKVEEEIGDIHWITRNYAVVGDYIQEQTNFTGDDPKTHPEEYE